MNELANSDKTFKYTFENIVQMPCAPFPYNINPCTMTETVSPQQRAMEVTQATYRKNLLTTLLPIKTVLYGEPDDSGPNPWAIAGNSFDSTYCANDPDVQADKVTCDEIMAYSGLLEMQVAITPYLFHAAALAILYLNWDNYNEVNHFNRWRLGFWDRSQTTPPLAATASVPATASLANQTAWTYIRSVLTRQDIWAIMDVPLGIGSTRIIAQPNDVCSTAITVWVAGNIRSGTVAGCAANPSGTATVYSDLPPDSAWHLSNLTSVVPVTTPTWQRPGPVFN